MPPSFSLDPTPGAVPHTPTDGRKHHSSGSSSNSGSSSGSYSSRKKAGAAQLPSDQLRAE
ncbi:hypothetical protein EYF80_034508 [Liparis tanakae]|uniref:Uncharacterized protein n=1 Tax=Liparis tanakae TaxID=230148 RepID=A0A4Z2GRA2_9TELE|nr:hypothetical protein EYF80_034508 [Liparis tanakae]